MEKELIKFNENITKINKDICSYSDDKGNYNLIPTGQLFVSCEYIEMTDEEYRNAKFKQIVDKNLELETKKATRVVDKYMYTKNKKDMGKLIEKEVDVKIAWVIKNGIGLTKSFNNKEEAIKTLKEINNKYFEIAEL